MDILSSTATDGGQSMAALDSEWTVQRLTANYTIEYQGSHSGRTFRLLHRVRSNQPIEVHETHNGEHFCAVLAQSALRRRWRRAVPGSWLVTRQVDRDGRLANSRYRHEATKLGAAKEYLFLRPHSTLSQELDEAEARPMPEQLWACGWTMVARTPDGWAEIYEGDGLPVVLHLVEDGTAWLLRWGWELVVWDTKTRELVYEKGGMVPVPLGLKSHSYYSGGLDDLLELHRQDRPDEGGSTGSYTWRMPDFHYHTSDGAVVCTESDGMSADRRNDPWPYTDEPLGPGD